MRLYHATLKSNLDGIIEKGIDPSFSKGAEQVIWLHTAGRKEWAMIITTQRHQCEVSEVMTIAVEVPRSKLRRRWHGLWSYRSDDPKRFTASQTRPSSQRHPSHRIPQASAWPPTHPLTCLACYRQPLRQGTR